MCGDITMNKVQCESLFVGQLLLVMLIVMHFCSQNVLVKNNFKRSTDVASRSIFMNGSKVFSKE